MVVEMGLGPRVLQWSLFSKHGFTQAVSIWGGRVELSEVKFS